MVQRFCASTELSALIYFFTPHNVKWVMRYADCVVQAYLDFWFPQPFSTVFMVRSRREMQQV